MREAIIDLIKHTQNGSLFESIRVSGKEKETKFEAMDKDKVLFLVATLKEAVPDFVGEFGMTNLKLLNGLVSFASYSGPDSTFEVSRWERGGNETVEYLRFGDGKGGEAIYRMAPPPEGAQIANIPWGFSFSPNRSKVAEFNQLSNLYSEVDKHFGTKTVDNNLVFTVGTENSSTHRASMIFESNVAGELKTELTWNIDHFQAIMKMAGNDPATVRITPRGVMGIEIDTQYATYLYYLRVVR